MSAVNRAGNVKNDLLDEETLEDQSNLNQELMDKTNGIANPRFQKEVLIIKKHKDISEQVGHIYNSAQNDQKYSGMNGQDNTINLFGIQDDSLILAEVPDDYKTGIDEFDDNESSELGKNELKYAFVAIDDNDGIYDDGTDDESSESDFDLSHSTYSSDDDGYDSSQDEGMGLPESRKKRFKKGRGGIRYKSKHRRRRSRYINNPSPNVGPSSAGDDKDVKPKRDRSKDRVSLSLDGSQASFVRTLDVKEQEDQNKVEEHFFDLKKTLGLSCDRVRYDFTHNSIELVGKGKKYDLSDKKSVFKYYMDNSHVSLANDILGDSSLKGSLDCIFEEGFSTSSDDQLSARDKKTKDEVVSFVYRAFDENWTLDEIEAKLEQESFTYEQKKAAFKIIKSINKKHSELTEICESTRHLMRKRIKPALTSAAGIGDRDGNHPFFDTSKKVNEFLHKTNKNEDRIDKAFAERNLLVQKSNGMFIWTDDGMKAKAKMHKARKIQQETLRVLKDAQREKQEELEEQRKNTKVQDVKAFQALQQELRSINTAIKEIEHASLPGIDWTLMQLTTKHEVIGEDGRATERKTGDEIIRSGNAKHIRTLARNSAQEMHEVFTQENGTYPRVFGAIPNPFGGKENRRSSPDENSEISNAAGGLIYHLKPKSQFANGTDYRKQMEKKLEDPIKLQHIDYHRANSYGRLSKPPSGTGFILDNAINSPVNDDDKIDLRGIGKRKFRNIKVNNPQGNGKISLEDVIVKATKNACKQADRTFKNTPGYQSYQAHRHLGPGPWNGGQISNDAPRVRKMNPNNPFHQAGNQ